MSAAAVLAAGYTIPRKSRGTSAWDSERRTSVSCYANPNALCPACGALVYFYRSPYNGRVFFDELGWPWPKHGCTDRGYEPRRAEPGIRIQHEAA